jgi:hypothetical protein
LLRKELRKKLIEHGWVYIDKHGNPSQAYARIRSQVDRSFNDLELLLRAGIPEEKEEQLFSVEKITKFAEALVKGSRSVGSDPSRYRMLQTRRSQIALILAEIGLEFLISQYLLLSKRTPSLGQTAIDELRHAVLMCRDISDEIISRSLESKTQREKTVHMFDWEMVPGRHNHRLRDFLMERLKSPNLSFITEEHTPVVQEFKITKDDKDKLECYLVCDLYWETREGRIQFDSSFDINATIEIQGEKKALLQIDRQNGIYREELIVQRGNNYLHILTKEEDGRCFVHSN